MNIAELEKAIEHHNRLYWVENSPEISDIEYDKLVEELRNLDPNNSLLGIIGTQKISGNKVIHRKPMLSLDKIYKFEELFRWVKGKSRSPEEVFLIQPKYDGISAKYEYGILSSRGNGIEGNDYTSRLPLIDFDMPPEKKKENHNSDRKYLLGEIVIKNDDFANFKKYKTKSGNPFKNSRNAVAGIMGCDDVTFYSSQGLKVTFVDYDLISYEVPAKDFEICWNEVFERIKFLGYPMDGIVVKVKDPKYSESLGYTEHHPKSQVAFKFSNQTRVSKIVDIEISQGKENLSAIAIVKPVEFDGVTVQRVKIPVTKPVDRDLPCIIEGGIAIGDTIEIERSGDVIPNVVNISSGKNRKVFKLEKCPFCGSALVINDTNVRCENENCFDKKLNKLMFSLECIGFLGIGKVFLREVMRHTGIEDIGQFMELSEMEIADSGIGCGNAHNIFYEKERCRKNKRGSVLTALNVPSLGNSVSKLLLERFSVDEILNDLTYEKLIAIKGIGEVMAREICGGIAANRKRLKEIVSIFDFEEETKRPETKGTICFTGKMDKPRSEMEAIAKEKGFAPVDSVSKNLSMLVVGEKAGSKLKKAQKLGIKVISEQEFIEL